MHVKKGDTVFILSGDDKGKTAKVLRVFPNEGKVLVEGVNVMKRHEKARKQGGKGQIVDKAMPIAASKVRVAGEAKSSAAKASKSAKAAKK